MRPLTAALARFCAIALTAFALTALGGLPAAAQLAPTPRDSVTVTDGVVRLGDLFLNAGGKADRPVATAPAPGERITLDGARLAAIAADAGLDWQPRGRGDRIMIERASRLVDPPQIERRLAQAVAAQLPGREPDVELETRPSAIHLPVGDEAGIRFEDLRVDERNARVTATLVAPTGDGRESRTPVAGRLHPVIDVPVLGRPVMPGEEIRETDLDWIRTRVSKLRRGVLTDAQYIVGRTPRRPIAPGAPLSVRDLQERIIVGKNSLVTILMRSPQMMLTTRGKALENGAEGAAIRVLNTGSDRTLEAIVIGPDLVEVKPAAALAAFPGTIR